MTTTEQWVTLTEASKDVKVTATKLSRLARTKVLKSKRDVRDMRVVLVDLNEVRAMFPPTTR